MTNKRKILEIGPGPNPMHHLREGKGMKPFKLELGDDYTALDLNGTVFNSEVWSKLKSKYRNRIQMVVGDKEKICFKEDAFDEVVTLGTRPGNLEGLDQVIKLGGLLRIGVTYAGLKKNKFVKELLSMGFKLVDELDYTYQPISKWPATSYVVVTFKKEK